MSLRLAIAALVALDSSPYTPEVEPPSASRVPTARPAEYEVECDDPLERLADCRLKARKVCKGDFKVVKQTETQKPPAAGIEPPFEESRGRTQRVLRFICRKSKARSL